MLLTPVCEQGHGPEAVRCINGGAPAKFANAHIREAYPASLASLTKVLHFHTYIPPPKQCNAPIKQPFTSFEFELRSITIHIRPVLVRN
jgi:hypothetical protein